MLGRILEAEVMDSPEEARDYDAMDHTGVNHQFVSDLVAAGPRWWPVDGVVLDLGTGTAQIPIELCRQHPDVRVVAVDLGKNMLEQALRNVQHAGLYKQISLRQVDAKSLPFEDNRFACVMSNSIVHHIPEPIDVLVEAVRVLAEDGFLLVRDLLRPADTTSLDHLVRTYAAGANQHQRKMFRDSLHAALTVAEVEELVQQLGFPKRSVQQTSDRHWTWIAKMKDRRPKTED